MPASMLGREADIDRLEGEVLAHRLVVLQGPVGVGKTFAAPGRAYPSVDDSRLI